MGALQDLKNNAGTLTDFAENPLGFIREHVNVIIAGGVIAAVEQLVGVYQLLYERLRDAVFIQSGTAIGEALGVLASIPFDILGSLNTMLVTGAQAGGPLAPLIYVFVWSVLLIVVVEVLRLIWRSIVVVT